MEVSGTGSLFLADESRDLVLLYLNNESLGIESRATKGSGTFVAYRGSNASVFMERGTKSLGPALSSLQLERENSKLCSARPNRG